MAANARKLLSKVNYTNIEVKVRELLTDITLHSTESLGSFSPFPSLLTNLSLFIVIIFIIFSFVGQTSHCFPIKLSNDTIN